MHFLTTIKHKHIDIACIQTVGHPHKYIVIS